MPFSTYGGASILGSISVLLLSIGYPSLAVLSFVITVCLIYAGPLFVDGKNEDVGRHEMELVSCSGDSIK